MYHFSRRVLTVVLCVALLLTAMPMAAVQAAGAQEYASKVLYALDESALREAVGQYADQFGGRNRLAESTADYPNVELLGNTPGIRAWNDKYYNTGEVNSPDNHKDMMFLTAGSPGGAEAGVKNITYKITSSNPAGFTALDISFLGRVESMGGDGFLAVQGSDTAPTGEFDTEDYFNGFTDLRTITDSTPGKPFEGTHVPPAIARENETTDYYSYGETLTLTDEVEGKRDYYVNFSFVSEHLMYTMLGDISFTEQIPVAYSDSKQYEQVVMGSNTFTGIKDRQPWWSPNLHEHLPNALGIPYESYDQTTLVVNGYPGYRSVDLEDTSKSNNGFAPAGSWDFASITYQLLAPEGKTFDGLIFEYDGKLSVSEEDNRYTSVAVTTYVGDSPTEMGVAKRLASYTDAKGTPHNLEASDWAPFSVEGNGKSEIWIRVMLTGGEVITNGVDSYALDAYLKSTKLTAVFENKTVPTGEEITDENYASNLLYTLDTGSFAQAGPIGTDVSANIRTSAQGQGNVEVLDASDAIVTGSAVLGYADGLPTAENIVVLTAAGGEKRNITYKITSSNPDGFEELDISYIGGVSSQNGSSYLAIQGSDTAPTGEFGSAEYLSGFGDIRRITDSTPGEATPYPYAPKDYHDYGETLVLTDAVEGRQEYYINFQFSSEEAFGTWGAWLSEIAFVEKVPVDFSDTNRYSPVTLANMDYTGNTMDRNWRGHIWQESLEKGETPTPMPEIVPNTENCKLVDVRRNLMFQGDDPDGTPTAPTWLGFADNAERSTWTTGAFVMKLTAPEGKVFKGLVIDLGGQNTIEACAGKNMATSITVSAGDAYERYTVDTAAYNTSLGAVKRFISYTDSQAMVPKNTGKLTPFKVVGNNKKEMYVKIAIGGGEKGWNKLTSMKIDGIFAEESVIDSIDFNGKGAFPTDGTLTAVYRTGAPKEGEQMPEELTFILSVYKKESDGTRRLIAVKTLTEENPEQNTAYTVELTGLPQDSNDYCAKAFVWSGLSGMVPIGSVYTLE